MRLAVLERFRILDTDPEQALTTSLSSPPQIRATPIAACALAKVNVRGTAMAASRALALVMGLHRP